MSEVEILELIPRKIKTALEHKGWSQKKLTQEISVSEQGFVETLKNKTLKVSTLLKIGEKLGMPLDYFIPIEDNSSNTSYFNVMFKEMQEEITTWKKRAYKAEAELSEIKNVIAKIDNNDKSESNSSCQS